MELIDRNSILWSYLPPELQGLIADGETLLTNMEKKEARENVSDFSFLVFPFAKAYEGFVKKVFLDLEMITHDEYFGDEIRVGRLLNPGYMEETGNVFAKFCNRGGSGRKLSEDLWKMWRRGRNRVFHYFPHNFRKLDYSEALEIVKGFVEMMEKTVAGCSLTVEP
ncbi:hypothetical protein OAL67_00090 [bacterium]|nr:hypothetical protein [bacterium]